MAIQTRALRKVFVSAAARAIVAGVVGCGAAHAQGVPRAAALDRLQGVWIEGPGFEVSYGGTYEGCAQRCLDRAACVMIEYYRPEKKCNLYDAKRPTRKGGASDVGIKR